MQQFRPFASFSETNGVGLLEEQPQEDNRLGKGMARQRMGTE